MRKSAYDRVQARLQRKREALTKTWRLTKNGIPFGENLLSAQCANVALIALLNQYFRDNPTETSHPYNFASFDENGNRIT